MNHYPHHIGDFDRATRHLTRLERSIYRDLLDLYYDTEQPLTLDMAALCRKIIARSNEESTAVEQVLNEFFTKTTTGWYQARCEAEIEAYRNNSSQKAQAGRASAEAKRLKKEQALNGSATDVEQPLPAVATNGNGTPTNQNHEPVTSNQEPEEKSISDKVVGAAVAARPEPAKSARLPDDWVLPMAWGQWAQAEFPHWTPDAVRLEGQKFADHWRTKSGKDGRKADWQAAWRNWCRSDIAQRAHPPGRPTQVRDSPPTFAERDRQARAAEMAKWAPGIAARTDFIHVNPPLETLNVVAIEGR